MEEGLAVLLNEPVPLPAMLHAPVPVVAVLAAKVTVVKPQVADPVWSGPALAVVGFLLNLMITESFEAVHGLLDIVQTSVSVAPAVPVKVEEGLALLLNEPVPVPAMLHAPVPTVAVFPARVTVVNPQVAEPV